MHNKILNEIELAMSDIKKVSSEFLRESKQDYENSDPGFLAYVATGKLKAYVTILEMLIEKYKEDQKD